MISEEGRKATWYCTVWFQLCCVVSWLNVEAGKGGSCGLSWRTIIISPSSMCWCVFLKNICSPAMLTARRSFITVVACITLVTGPQSRVPNNTRIVWWRQGWYCAQEWIFHPEVILANIKCWVFCMPLILSRVQVVWWGSSRSPVWYCMHEFSWILTVYVSQRICSYALTSPPSANCILSLLSF